MKEDKLGVDKAKWDLSIFYSGINDKKLEGDIKAFSTKARKFHNDYNGKLATKLGKAIVDYSDLRMLTDKILVYLYLLKNLDLNNQKVRAKMSEVQNTLNKSDADYLTFFGLELKKLDDKVINNFAKKDEVVRKHLPWIEYTRVFKKHVLSEEVESALTKRHPFGPESWSNFFDEFVADLSFVFKGEKKSLIEMNHIMSEDKNADNRAEALLVLNEGLKGIFAKFSAQNLYMVAGSKSVESDERDYKNPMDFRNKANRLPDTVVESLHSAVLKVGGPLAQRYYKLKANLLGLKTLKWSDRNAPMSFSDTNKIPFDEALEIVLAAYGSFSPTLANLIRDTIKTKRIDAQATKGKISGAFNYSIVLPGNIPVSFVLLNYLGSSRDVMTLAHELGHCVHGLLAGKEQGVLMSQSLIAYCETASIFGEVTTFNFLKKKLYEKGDKESLLALIMSKIDDTLNTTVRQISFSNFERRVHGLDSKYKTWNEPKNLSVEELNKIWLDVTKEMYGKEGHVFTYENTDHLWSYIRHFHRPFYVYGYSFGDLLTSNLYAKQFELGDKFEGLYLDLLSSGMTRDIVKLLKPFGLNPTKPDFWTNGLKFGLGEMIKEAEQLAKELRKVNIIKR